jgi:hypothetical protein
MDTEYDLKEEQQGVEQFLNITKWHEQRWGKFTSSENHKLMGSGRKKDDLFGVAAMTYINKKASEIGLNFYEQPELEEVKSLLHGKYYEEQAFERFVLETKINNLALCGSENPIFIPNQKYIEYAGGSPDAVSIDDEGGLPKVIVEIKNPKNPSIHYERLFWKTAQDVEDNNIQAYTQIQDLMWICGSEIGYFVSHDSRRKKKSEQIKIIEIKPNKIFVEDLEHRLSKAIEIIELKHKILSDEQKQN